MAYDSLKSLLGSSPLIKDVIHDKIIGTIFGSALGDAIGLYTEFLSQSESKKEYPTRKFSLVEPVTRRKQDSHRSKFPPASWTDDTDHAILLILGYLHNSNGDPPSVVDLALRLRVWVKHGLVCLGTECLDVGITTRRVALREDFIQHPQAVAFRDWVEGGCRNAANGSLMRAHPIGIMCLDRSLRQSFKIAAELSMVTHPDPRCIFSCCVSVGLIRGLIRGEITEEYHIDEMIIKANDWYGTWTIPGYQALLLEMPEVAGVTTLDDKEWKRHLSIHSLSELELDDPQKMGYVYKALGSAVLLLRLALRKRKENPELGTEISLFEDLITYLIMEGGDGDTNACVAGSFLGAYFGYKALPVHWRDGLRSRLWVRFFPKWVSKF
jgi:ADP-ribosylglycohydrolase